VLEKQGETMLKTRITAAVVTAGLVVAALTACSAASSADPAPTVSALPGDGVLRIADLTPLTGDLAKYAAAQAAGVDLAVREVNDQGGFNGKPISVIHRNAGDANEATAAASFKDAVAKGVDVIIAPASTSATAALLKLAAGTTVAVVAIASKDNAAAGATTSTVKADDAFTKRLKQIDPSLSDTTYGVEAYDATVASILAATFAKSDNGQAVAQGLVAVSYKKGISCSSFGACADVLKSQPFIDYVGLSGQFTYTPTTAVISFSR
jgi:branched-chain amino acid transport system substrate-binding protein